MRHRIVGILALLALQTLQVLGKEVHTALTPITEQGLTQTANTTITPKAKLKKRKNKDKKKAVIFYDFKCQESYNKLVDNGICRTLGVPAPDLTDCASGASVWSGSAKTEKLKGRTSQGEYESGKCAVSVFNQSKKTIKYSRAVLGLWWNAAANACVYPGSAWDSAQCTVLNNKGQPSGVVLVLSRKGHNKDFKANVISEPGNGK